MRTENDPLIAATLAAALLGKLTPAELGAARGKSPAQIAAHIYFDCIEAVQNERTNRNKAVASQAKR